MAHPQKPDFFFRAKRTSPFKSAGGRQFSRLLAAEVCAISGSNAGYTMFRGSVKSTGHPLHSPVSPLRFPSRASPCAITFQLESNTSYDVFRLSFLSQSICRLAGSSSSDDTVRSRNAHTETCKPRALLFPVDIE